MIVLESSQEDKATPEKFVFSLQGIRDKINFTGFELPLVLGRS